MYLRLDKKPGPFIRLSMLMTLERRGSSRDLTATGRLDIAYAAHLMKRPNV
jgi:hypothetical protein